MKRCNLYPSHDGPLKEFRRISILYIEDANALTIIIYPVKPDPETKKVQSYIMSGKFENVE